MTRLRKPRRRNWPQNLYSAVVSGRVYYRYRDPATGKVRGIGTDFEAARAAVAQINTRQATPATVAVLAKIARPRVTLGEHLIWYDEQVLQARGLAASTLEDSAQMLTTIARQIGPQVDVAMVDRKAIAAFLATFPARMSNRYRSLLNQVFRHAVAQGLRDDNPVTLTIQREAQVQRERLSLAHFDTLRAAAEPWFQRALDLARWSLQRRGDLCRLTVDDWAAGALSVRQQKVERHGAGLLRVKAGPMIEAAVRACIDSGERGNCPYLLHRTPAKIIKAAWRTHHKQIAPEMLTREFAELRDRHVAELAALPAARRPSFHEIRALGADYYRDGLKWTEPSIQSLLGHSSATMTRVYLDRHGERWTDVEGA